jgi:hypothetical protein
MSEERLPRARFSPRLAILLRLAALLKLATLRRRSKDYFTSFKKE